MGGDVFRPKNSASERPATARRPLWEAGPERASQGSGPEPGGIDENSMLFNHSYRRCREASRRQNEREALVSGRRPGSTRAFRHQAASGAVTPFQPRVAAKRRAASERLWRSAGSASSAEISSASAEEDGGRLRPAPACSSSRARGPPRIDTEETPPQAASRSRVRKARSVSRPGDEIVTSKSTAA